MYRTSAKVQERPGKIVLSASSIRDCFLAGHSRTALPVSMQLLMLKTLVYYFLHT